MQNQIEPLFILTKNELTTENITLLRKLIWETITLTNKSHLLVENVSSFKFNNTAIESFNSNSNLANEFLFDAFDGFNIAIGGIAAAIGLLAFGPFGLLAGALGILFGESKQTKVVRKTKDEIKNYIKKIETNINDNINDIIEHFKVNVIAKIDDSFKEYNGNNKDDVIRNFYWTDSMLSNQLKYIPTGLLLIV